MRLILERLSQETVASGAEWDSGVIGRGRVERAMSRLEVPFVQWLVMETLDEVLGDLPEANQNDVARRAGLSRAVVSYWMRKMERDWLVDRGEHQSSAAWSVILTQEGHTLLRRCREYLGGTMQRAGASQAPAASDGAERVSRRG